MAGVQMGPNAVQNPGALVSALRSQAPAPNPKTPLERFNPDLQALEQIKAATVSLERAGQFTNDTHMTLVLNAMQGVLTKALLKFDGQSVMQALQESVAAFPPLVAPAAGGMQPPGAGAMPPVPPGGPAAPQAMPPQGAPA